MDVRLLYDDGSDPSTIASTAKPFPVAVTGGGGTVPSAMKVDVSKTMTGAWIRVTAEDTSRSSLDLQNVGANNIGVYRAPAGNNNTPPVPVGMGNLGVNTVLPGGGYSPGVVDQNEIWAIGTLGDVLTAFKS